MRNVARLRQEPMTAFGLPVLGGAVVPTTGQHWWVDPNAAIHTPKYSFGHGKSQDYPFETLAEAEAASQTGDTICIHGNIREENVVFSNLKFDRKVVGIGGLHHPDQPSSAYHPGGAMIRPPSSPTATTDLIVVRGRGTQFHNVAFDCPVDAAAVKLVSNASSGTSEYDGSHAIFSGCSFQQGLYGIQDVGGVINVIIDDCMFKLFTPTGAKAIVNTSTAVRLPQVWKIRDCYFPATGASGGNECHIDAPLDSSLIVRSYFGTVEGTALYIDLTGGAGNIVTTNHFMGSYSTDDYVAGTGDDWIGNTSIDLAETEVDTTTGITIAVPAA